MSMNPRETTEKIRIDYQDYIASILSVRDQEITNMAHNSVRNTEFVKGPYLETTLPFVQGKSLKDLSEEGLVSKEFATMGNAVHFEDWRLRIHQENALRHIINDKRNMVVSTGTGSGKTECYLYPIFNKLMREKENNTLDAGVRALLICPMNALANDQQKKLRKLLRYYPDITFGRYTGETAHKSDKETPEQAEKRLHEEYDSAHMTDTDELLRKSIPNEMMCREMMANKPPHILLTNYAMLEYMLLQPDTAPFFDNESAKNWTFIVIDEAHTYKGANGTEIAFLLRRVNERIRQHMKQPFQCIATSATLGSNDAKAGLAAFAQTLFDEPFDAEDVITTERQHRIRPSDGRLFIPEEYVSLKEKATDMTERERGLFLYNALLKDLRLFSVYDALSTKPKRIEEVASIVFGDINVEIEREKALINLIELAAAAKKSEDESALLPARYHLFIKSLEGMFAQYYPQKMVYLDRKEYIKERENVYAVFELANCQKCEQEYLVGKTVTRGKGNYFVQTSSTDKPEYYFISTGNIENLTEFDEDDSIEETDKMQELEKYHLCLCCGRITRFAVKHPDDCCGNADPNKIVTVYNLKYMGRDSESNCCPCCGATKKGLIKRFLTANQPATFAVAKSLYDAIPPRPIHNVSIDNDIFSDDIFDDDIFADDLFDNESDKSDSVKIQDESGRKLLVFSDNRQEAAFFAGFFEKKYSLIMWRKVILQCLKEAGNEGLFFNDLIKRATSNAEKNGLYTFDQERGSDLTDDQKKELAAHYIMQEFLTPDISTGLEGLGYIEIEPDQINFKSNISIAGLKGKDLWNLVRFMMDTLRQKGAVTYPEGIRATDDFFAPRNHAGYFRETGSKNERTGYTYGFIPQESTLNKRLSFMLKLLKTAMNDSEEEINKAAREELRSVYRLLLKLEQKRYIVRTTDSTRGVVYCLNFAKWKFRYLDNNHQICRCRRCKKIFPYSIKNICPEMKCNGELEIIEARKAKNEPYYNNLFSDDKLVPMVAREHTAQLSSKTAGLYQKEFEEGKINVLSCSTTFEMGVDVGELEATFQRNVPPETANYIQRAGRAGRRTSSAAFSVTFSRRNSHDMTFFHEPAKIIAGKINAPVLEIDNEKIAERHLNSIVMSWFFKNHPEFFFERTRKILSFRKSENMADVLKKSLSDHPQEILDSIHRVLPEDICESLKVDDWVFTEDLTGIEGSLTRAIAERTADIESLTIYSDELKKENSDRSKKALLNKAAAAERIIETLEDESSINFLSSKGVLPKYGFPIDTVSLDIISGDEVEEKKIDLSRDLKMAISEFAPPAQIVANGRVWKSYSINTVPDKSWPTYIYYECPSCKRVYPPQGNVVDIGVKVQEEPRCECASCGTMMNAKKFIVPLFGFSTKRGDKPRPVGESRPSTYYSIQILFWGIDSLTEKQKAEAMERKLSLGGKELEITYSPGGKLFVLNQGKNGRGLRICPSCGFANDPATVLRGNRHETKYGKICNNRSLQYASLGHSFSTDILKIKLPDHKVEIEMPEGTGAKNQYLSVLYAILEGASTELDISRDDINGCVYNNSELILFDDAAGGAGFVKHIYNNFENVLKAAKNKVSGRCGCTEETSCYGCLRNYSNQFYHDHISRGLAFKYIEWLLNSKATITNNTDNSVSVEASVKPNIPEEHIGLRPARYQAPDTSSYPDSVAQLKDLAESAEDETVKNAYLKLMEAIGDKKVEHPIIDDCIPLQENIWPELFWGRSRVALFEVGNERQYEILREYDWYCYMLNEELNVDLVVSHLLIGGIADACPYDTANSKGI